MFEPLDAPRRIFPSRGTKTSRPQLGLLAEFDAGDLVDMHLVLPVGEAKRAGARCPPTVLGVL
jgi:hypothetical protein